MGDSLPGVSNEFLQLHIYAVSVVCVVRSDAVFALYSNDERSGKTVGTGYGVEESVRDLGLGVCCYRITRGNPSAPLFSMGSKGFDIPPPEGWRLTTSSLCNMSL